MSQNLNTTALFNHYGTYMSIYSKFNKITNEFQYSAFLKHLSSNPSLEVIVRVYSNFSSLESDLESASSLYFFNKALSTKCTKKNEKVVQYISHSRSKFARTILVAIEYGDKDLAINFFKNNPGSIDLLIEEMKDVVYYDYLCKLFSLISEYSYDKSQINKANRVYNRVLKLIN